jgi:hypothetical protein
MGAKQKPKPAEPAGDSAFRELLPLLKLGRPKTPKGKKERFGMLLEAYSNPALAGKFRELHALYQSKQKQLKNAAGKFNLNEAPLLRSIQLQRWRHLAKEVRELESNLAHYWRLRAQLESCAQGDAGRQEIKKAGDMHWQRIHGKLFRPFQYWNCMYPALQDIGISREQAGRLYECISQSMDSQDKAQYFEIGTGSTSHQKALQIRELLEKFPELMLTPDTVETVWQKTPNGKTLWAVAICSGDSCMEAAQNRRSLRYVPVRRASSGEEGLMDDSPASRSRSQAQKGGHGLNKKGKPKPTKAAVPRPSINPENFGKVPLDLVSPWRTRPHEEGAKTPENAQTPTGAQNKSAPQEKEWQSLSRDPLSEPELGKGGKPAKRREHKSLKKK